MSFQQKRALVSLFGTVVITFFYARHMFAQYPAADAGLTAVFEFWAALILIYVPVQVIFKVILHVIFIIFNTIVGAEEEPGFLDELDNQVELKSLRNFSHLFIAMFFLAMAALAVFHQPPTVMFGVLATGIFAASVMMDVSQIYYYRNGV